MPAGPAWTDRAGASIGCCAPGRERLHPLPGRADHPDQLERRRRRHAGPGCDRRLQRLLRDPGADPGRRRPVERLPAARLGVRRFLDALGRDIDQCRVQLRPVLRADRDGDAVRAGGELPLRVEPRRRGLHPGRLLGGGRLPRQRLCGRHRPRRLRPVLGHAADADQRLELDRVADADSGTAVRFGARQATGLHRSGAWRSGATVTGWVTTRTSSTRWRHGWRTPPTTWPTRPISTTTAAGSTRSSPGDLPQQPRRLQRRLRLTILGEQGATAPPPPAPLPGDGGGLVVLEGRLARWAPRRASWRALSARSARRSWSRVPRGARS